MLNIWNETLIEKCAIKQIDEEKAFYYRSWQNIRQISVIDRPNHFQAHDFYNRM